MNADPYQAPRTDAVRSVSLPQFVAALAVLTALQGVAISLTLGIAWLTGGLGFLCAIACIAAAATAWRVGVRRRLGDAWGMTVLCLLAYGALVVLVTVPMVARPVAEGTVNLLMVGVALVSIAFATVAGVVIAQVPRIDS